MQVERGRPAARGKLVDVILLVGTAALVLASSSSPSQAGGVRLDQAPSRSARYRRRASSSRGSASGVPLLLTAGVVLLLYRFVPARRLRLGDALAGAIVTALLLFAISLVSGYLRPCSSLSLSNIYGSLTSALVFLYSVYLYASALLLGAEVAAAWSRPSEPTDEPLSRQVRRVALGLFVHQDPPPPAGDTRRGCRPIPLTVGRPTRVRSAPAAPSRGAPGARSRAPGRSRPEDRAAACARAGAAASRSRSVS